MEKVIICSIVALISLVLAAGSGLDKSSTLESVIARLAFNDRTTRSKTLESSPDKQRDGENINARLEDVERQLLAFKSTLLERRTPCTSKRSHEFVSFQVKLNQHKVVQKQEVLKFDTVTDNKGGGYHATSGIFEAPVSGTYLFWANILGYNNGYLNIALIKEGVTLAIGYGLYEDKYSVAPLTFMTDMNEGEKVWFTKQQGTLNIYGNFFSYYGGVLLHAA
ncbi:uncharacterized protein LOC124135795 isoform X2 [Haliotis rufescens]|uniref:uncharacterized protein LOC124135795 isoform X2 n=1 Tax=Haliotis rufescens TaxID=6454 RepID=UPI00201FAA7C|nr:uncharacterized protein LOC124135795 isoform X2 [Haliotis rufescens]